MSFPKNDRKIRSRSGKTFPKSAKESAKSTAYGFAAGIAAALHRAYGNSHAGVKTVVALTGANERAVRNRFEGKNGPSGEHLIELVRHSDPALAAFLVLAGRERVLTAKLVIDAKDKLIEILELIRQLESDDTATEG
jgi:hypothetical protein